jgi:hypothetical protein
MIDLIVVQLKILKLEKYYFYATASTKYQIISPPIFQITNIKLLSISHPLSLQCGFLNL